jgi:hypothetical protein
MADASGAGQGSDGRPAPKRDFVAMPVRPSRLTYGDNLQFFLHIGVDMDAAGHIGPDMDKKIEIASI